MRFDGADSYRSDPLQVLLNKEKGARKWNLGCSVCIHSVGHDAWGKTVCGKGRYPLKGKTYCNLWVDRE